MKTKYLIILLFLIFIISCKSSSFIYNRQMKDAYIYSFKLIYYKNLMLKGFNNSENIKTLIRNDGSGYSEFILSIEDYNIIDSLTRIDSQLMINDSIDRIGKVAEGTEGKRVLDFSLNKYCSKWLDDLANERYRIKN